VEGLYKMPGPRARWRYKSPNGKFIVFTEPDERVAIARFLAATRSQEEYVTLPAKPVEPAQVMRELLTWGKHRALITIPHDPARPVTVAKSMTAPDMWAWMREMLLTESELCARMTGIPQLATIASWDLPKEDIRLHDLIETYRRENGGSGKSKKEALAALERLIAHSGAKTLRELTQERLTAFRTDIEKVVPGPATRKAYYGRIKAVIAFGLKCGLEPTQIRRCLDRCKVLWTAAPLPAVQPKPISRDHFHALLAAGGPAWRPWLLLGLNLCLHMEEVCGLRWADFDLEKGTYAAIREKTRRARIPRAAVLWPETIRALKGLPRRSEYVFTSTHGTRYNKNIRINDFAELRGKANLPAAVTFDTLRDGAYTAAIQGTPDERWARVLAGHRAAGLQDNYVLRKPEAVCPACDAVYRTYGPFADGVAESDPERKA
jgi:integrase